MRSPEDFPADIRKAAFAVVARGYDEGLVEVVCRALMERDRAATERAAKIAEDEDGHFSHWGEDRNTRVAQQTCRDIAAAIRSQP
jgi:hypothetical protein